MNILKKILFDKESTTKVIESISKRRLKVHIKSQTTETINNELILKRESILFLEEINEPILCSLCLLQISKLSNFEYNKLIEGEIPIGNIFLSQPKKVMSKKNIRIDKIIDNEYTKILNVENIQYNYRKTYELMINNKILGVIMEFFNQESLKRIKIKSNVFSER